MSPSQRSAQLLTALKELKSRDDREEIAQCSRVRFKTRAKRLSISNRAAPARPGHVRERLARHLYFGLVLAGLLIGVAAYLRIEGRDQQTSRSELNSHEPHTKQRADFQDVHMGIARYPLDRGWASKLDTQLQLSKDEWRRRRRRMRRTSSV